MMDNRKNQEQIYILVVLSIFKMLAFII